MGVLDIQKVKMSGVMHLHPAARVFSNLPSISVESLKPIMYRLIEEYFAELFITD
jgi:hypothetical protein